MRASVELRSKHAGRLIEIMDIYFTLKDADVTSRGLDYLVPGALLTDLQGVPPSFRSLARGFPALLQRLETGAELVQWRAEAKRRKLRSVPVFNLAIELYQNLQSIASLYGIDE